MEPGCITQDLIQRSDVVLNTNHSNAVTCIFGRCANGKGTLELELRQDKVVCRCDMPKTNAANDTLELIKRGDITGMSFAFSDDYEDTENGVSYERTEEKTADGKEVWIRHVKRVTGLYDVSIVTHPAYEQTSVSARETGDAVEKAIEEQLKREQGAGTEETPEQKTERERQEAEAKKKRELTTLRLRTDRRHLEESYSY